MKINKQLKQQFFSSELLVQASFFCSLLFPAPGLVLMSKANVKLQKEDTKATCLSVGRTALKP